MTLSLRLLPDTFAVCRLEPGSVAPAWAVDGGIRSVTWTEHETSVLCSEVGVPADVAAERGWRALMVEGPLDFALTGVLARISEPLAGAGISIFAVSTFDTDYILVKEAALEEALRVLERAGMALRVG